MAAVTVEAGDRAGGESGAPGTGADLGGEEPDSPTELCNTVTVGGAQAVRTEFSATRDGHLSPSCRVVCHADIRCLSGFCRAMPLGNFVQTVCGWT